MEEAFFKYANKIADKLDYFVEIDELATDYVKNELYKLLYKLTGDAGVSLGIADGNDIFVTKTKANLFPEELFGTSVPEYKDAINVLLKIIESKDEEIIFKLLLSIYQQGMFKELIKHLLTPA